MLLVFCGAILILVMEEVIQPVQPHVPAPVQNIVKKFPKVNLKKIWPYVLGSVLVVIAGVGTGWLISGRGGAKSGVVPGAKVSQNEAGIADEKSFPDSADGTLEAGGISGEGTHHLVRSGGVSQTVYLTSTVVDLQAFVGKKVEVWGQTISGRKAGWLMDVGKIKVIE